MFAVTYSTQAILPEIGRSFDVGPAAAGLSISVVVLALRSLQGICMPGLLTAGVPYVAEAFVPTIGGRAMGYYVSSLVAGGLIGRVGVGLLAAVVGGRGA